MLARGPPDNNRSLSKSSVQEPQLHVVPVSVVIILIEDAKTKSRDTHLTPFGHIVLGDEFDSDWEAIGDSQARVDSAEAALTELFAHLV